MKEADVTLYLDEIVDCIAFQGWNLHVVILENFNDKYGKEYRASVSNQSQWAYVSQSHLSASKAIRGLYRIMVDNNAISPVGKSETNNEYE